MKKNVAPQRAKSVPAYWSIAEGPDGAVVLTFGLRKWALGLGLGGGLVALFGWGAWGFLKNWFIDHAEILPGGVILFLVFVAGLWAGLYVIDRLIFATVQYELTPENLVIRKNTLFRRKQEVIPRKNVREILINYLPPGPNTSTGNPGTYATLIVHERPNTRGTTNFAMEGWTEEEANWLAPQLARWSGIKYREIQSGEN